MEMNLKPCPFCGGRAEYDNETGANDDCFESWIGCVDCGCRVILEPYSTKQADAHAWNRRASQWQPIETAPKDGTLVIGVRLIATITKGDRTRREYLVMDARWQDGRFRFQDPLTLPPTHWMPFEEPPQ